MSDSLSLPLEIRHDQIDPLILEAVRKINAVAAKHETSYFLAGATAREVILRHVFGRPAGRRTLDIDFGIAVRDWEHFQTLKSALVEQAGFTVHARAHQRLIYPTTPVVIVDLIPFGGVEREDRTIAWPPEEDFVMRVAGFSDGMESSVPVRLADDLVVRVVSLPALLVLKLFAWLDRKQEKRDAPDIYTLLKDYGDAGNEDRLYGEALSILESEGYDVEIAGARLLGGDAAAVISADTRRRVRDILESDREMEELTNQIIVVSARNDPEHAGRCELLVSKLRQGFLQAP
jgi:predicted nucleotidyltransferase